MAKGFQMEVGFRKGFFKPIGIILWHVFTNISRKFNLPFDLKELRFKKEIANDLIAYP